MDLLHRKLQEQLLIRPEPIIACIDFDGTLYTAGKTMWKAPYYNRKTSQILQKQFIPFVLITGRADWKAVDEVELRVLGMTQPDIVVTGAGSMIYYRQTDRLLVEDKGRLQILKHSLFLWRDGNGKAHEETWNKERIIDIAQTYHNSNYLALSKDDDNTFVIRFTVQNMSIDLLEQIKSELKELFPAGIKILIAEKLLQKNTLHVFSGDILLVPARAGKDSAIEYLLDNLSSLPRKGSTQCREGLKLHAYLFGDSSIDIKMLAMPEDEKHYTLSQYGVHLTPRADRILHKVLEKNPNLQLTEKEGPKIIYHVFHQVAQSHAPSARNSYLRHIIRPFEQVINKTVYPNLTANELSFKGLSLVIKGIDMIYNSKATSYKKARGLHYYLLGMSLDAADGIRARHSVMKEENGQLVDVFCDRAKEFYQLNKRAIISPHAEGKHAVQERVYSEYQTLLTAISCILPSIARAQAEIEGVIVQEQDEKGGSMLQRSKRLFSALINDLHGNHLKSSKINQEIYKTNLATYEHRLSFLSHTNLNLQSIPTQTLTDLQKKALERFLLLVQVLQEENEIIIGNKNLCSLPNYPEFLKKYQKEFQPILADYLKIDVEAIRKNLQLPNPKLSLVKILNLS